MSASTARQSNSISAIVTSGFFQKALALAVAFVLLGFAAPFFLDENEFTGVLVGMLLSLGILIGLVLLVTVVSAVIRESLR